MSEFQRASNIVRTEAGEVRCNQCGNVIPNGMLFCTKCGTGRPSLPSEVDGAKDSISEPSIPQNVKPLMSSPKSDAQFNYFDSNAALPVENPVETAKAAKSKKGVVIAISSVCGALLIAAVLYFIFAIYPSAKISTITPYPSALKLQEGESAIIKLVIAPEKAKSEEIVWVTNNPSVASVEAGVVTAKGEGSCEITAASAEQSDVSATIQVVVVSVKKNEVAVSPDVDKDSKMLRSMSELADSSLRETSAEMVFPNDYLAESQVAAMSVEEIQFLVNCIYGKNGYIFQTPEVLEYFKMQPWYSPLYESQSSVDLSDIDSYNMNLLLNYRANKSFNSSITGIDSLWTYSMVDEELSEDFVSSLSEYDVHLLLATIYAKNGYIFSTRDLQSMVSIQYWYSGCSTDPSEMYFSETDRQNIELLGRYL